MASYLPLPKAGRDGMPAAVLNPDDPLPAGWGVISPWTYRGQRGAWVARISDVDVMSWHQGETAQVVYRATAPRSSRASHVGTCLVRAAELLMCQVRPATGRSGSRNPSWIAAQQAERRAYYEACGVDIAAVDKAADRRRAARRAGARPARSAPGLAPADMPEPAILSAPPSPGPDRVRWLGEQITAMTGDESADYVPHQRRRIAARRALALVDGYEASAPERDACPLFGTASLRLASLNEYARRVLDLGEPWIDWETKGGASDALL